MESGAVTCDGENWILKEALHGPKAGQLDADLTCKSAAQLYASAEFSGYVLQLKEELLYLHTALFDLGQLHILLLAHH